MEWITSQGWTVDFTAYDRCPPGFIEFRHRSLPPRHTFWRRTIRQAYVYLGGPA